MKEGSATLFVIVAMVVAGIIFSYIFSRTANSEINSLNDYSQIKEVYEKDLRDTDDNGVYDDIDSNIYTTVLSIISGVSNP